MSEISCEVLKMYEIKKRPPLQVWSPLIDTSINREDFKLDLIEAESFYGEEDFIWFSPKEKKIERFEQDMYNHLIMPSRTINKITVYNIDELGYLFPYVGDINKLDEPLYIKWLKKSPMIRRKNKPIEILFPKSTKEGIYYKKIKIEPEDAFIKFYKKNINIITGSKEDNQISMDFELDALDDILPKIKEGIIRPIWPLFFDSFFETGGGANTLGDFLMMKNYIKLYPTNKAEILQLIRNKVNLHVSNNVSSMKKSWFFPKFQNEQLLLIEIQGRFGINLNSIEEVKPSEKLNGIANSRVNIKRVYSWLGFFWWELYQDLLNQNTVKFCSHCGQIFSDGRADRIYCTSKENPDCWKSRAALRQKKKYHLDRDSNN